MDVRSFGLVFCCVISASVAACGGGESVTAPAVTLSISTSSIRESQSATLQWGSAKVANCTATGAWDGILPLSGSLSISPTQGDYEYAIECTDDGVAVRSAVSLTVNQAYEPQEYFGIVMHVDPVNGDDANDGGLRSPLRTLAAASHTAAKLAMEKDADVTVFLRKGIYRLDAPWILNASHSAPVGRVIIFRNFPGELPIVSSGVSVSGWSNSPDGKTVFANVPGNSFREFYVNRKWARRASYPNVYDGAPWLKFPERTVSVTMPTVEIPALQSPRIAEIAINNYWMEWRAFPDALNANQDGTTTASVYSGFPRDYHYHVSYYWQNALEFIDAPGEWFHDLASGKLTYFPRAGENPGNIDARIPTLETLVQIDGASNLMFYGIDFSETGWNEPTQKRDYLQRFGCLRYAYPGEIDPTNSEGSNIWNATPGAVEMRHASNIRFERNRFYNLATNAVVMREGVSNLSLEGNVFSDIGDTAVCVGVQMEPHPAQNLVNKNIDISNNLITRTGNNYHGGSGVVAFYVANLNIARNEFSNIPGWGVNIGWAFRKNINQSQAIQENTIAYNRFDNVTYWIADSGVIHTKGINVGGWHTKISDNVFENIGPQLVSDKWRSRAVIFLDDYTANVSIANNVMSNIYEWVYPTRVTSTNPGNSIFLAVSDERAVRLSSGVASEYSVVHAPLSAQSMGDAGLP